MLPLFSFDSVTCYGVREVDGLLVTRPHPERGLSKMNRTKRQGEEEGEYSRDNTVD